MNELIRAASWSGGERTKKSEVIGEARTPRSRVKHGKGALSAVHPQDVLALVVRAFPCRTGIDVRGVETT